MRVWVKNAWSVFKYLNTVAAAASVSAAAAGLAVKTAAASSVSPAATVAAACKYVFSDCLAFCKLKCNKDRASLSYSGNKMAGLMEGDVNLLSHL